MTFIYRVQVETNDGEISVWTEQGNSAELIKESVTRNLNACNVEGVKVTVQLGS